MLRNTTRIALILVCVGLTAWSARRGMTGFAIAYVALALAFGYAHFRYGSVWLAYRSMKRGRYEKAERLLADVRWPMRLTRAHRAYYHFVKGLVELNKRNLRVAEAALQKALDVGLRTTHDAALVNMYLAAIDLEIGREDQARTRLQQAAELPHRPVLNSQIQELFNRLPEQPEWLG